MEWAVLVCVLFATCLSIRAEQRVSSPQGNRSLYSDPVALFNGGKSEIREGAWLLLKDYMTQGNTLLKERLKESYSNLKELLKDGDSNLKERMVDGVAQVKEQLKEGDERLKEELNEDTAWLKDKLARAQTRMKEDVAEEEAKMKEELSGQVEAFEKLKQSIKQQLHSSSALVDEVKQQISDFQAELKSTKLQLQNELRTYQETLQSVQTDLQTTQDKLKNTEEELQRTREQLHNEVQTFTALKIQVQAAEDEVHSLKSENRLQSSHQDLQLGEHNFRAVGSTFIRWGHSRCPDNTSLVYSGVAGGTFYDKSGGASNYLCLVMEPQLDNLPIPEYFSSIHGAEYQRFNELLNQDVVCSVCWAPQTTTVMVPATLTCPAGWNTQYSGHITSTYDRAKGRTEYVCLDEAREYRAGGNANRNGALFYPVFAHCGSLPCPPYTNNKTITCVVCSMQV
ncbi:hypothetical protein ACOMHN_052310 [Nucella lapillus]